MTTKQFIAYLMDTSDMVAKMAREMDGMIASHRHLSDEEHEAIKSLLLGIERDAGMADSKRFEAYEWTKDRSFAAKK